MHLSQDEEGARQEVCPVKGLGQDRETTNAVLFSDRRPHSSQCSQALGALVRVSTSAGNSNLS